MTTNTDPLFVARTSSHSISLTPAPEQEQGSLPASLQLIPTPNAPSTIALTQSTYDKITTIISTKSGSEKAAQVHETLLTPLLEHLSIKTQVLTTTSSSSIKQFARTEILPQAQAGKTQLIILLSGDGGIVDLLAILGPAAASSSAYVAPTIALLPLGTGNALGNSSGILNPGDETLGLRALASGHAKPLPVFDVVFDPPAQRVEPGTGTINADDSVNVAAGEGEGEGYTRVSGAVVFSWALHAALVADSDTPEYRARGSSRFQLAARENLFPDGGKGRTHAYRGRLSVLPAAGEGEEEEERGEDKREWRGVPGDEYFYVLATTCAQLEKNFTVSPRSGALDGKLHVVHIGAVEGGGEQVMGAMMAAYDGGKHVDKEEVGYEEIEGIRLEVQEDSDRWRRVCVDGTIFVVPRGGKVEVRRRAGTPVLELLILDE